MQLNGLTFFQRKIYFAAVSLCEVKVYFQFSLISRGLLGGSKSPVFPSCPVSLLKTPLSLSAPQLPLPCSYTVFQVLFQSKGRLQASLLSEVLAS